MTSYNLEDNDPKFASFPQTFQRTLEDFISRCVIRQKFLQDV